MKGRGRNEGKKEVRKKKEKKETKKETKKERKFEAEMPSVKTHGVGSSGAETQGAEKPQCGKAVQKRGAPHFAFTLSFVCVL